MKRRIPTAAELYFPAEPHDPATLEHMEHDFIGTLRQSKGTYKYTYARRLDDLNERIAGLLPEDRPLRVMDVAVSSGVSTLEWSQDLDRRGIAHTMTAGDLNVGACLVALPGGRNVLVDGQGHPLQYDLSGRAVPNPPARRQLPLSWLGIALCHRGLRRTTAPVKRAALQEHGTTVEAGLRAHCRAVRLVSPRLLGNPRITLIEDDILQENQALRGRFHVLRAANILNRAYFDEATLARIVANLRDRLVEGGRLVVCSTSGDVYRGDPVRRSNDGTIFARRGGMLDVLGRLCQGSALESLILERTARPTSVVAGPPTT
jgi:hypothetical protein